MFDSNFGHISIQLIAGLQQFQHIYVRYVRADTDPKCNETKKYTARQSRNQTYRQDARTPRERKELLASWRLGGKESFASGDGFAGKLYETNDNGFEYFVVAVWLRPYAALQILGRWRLFARCGSGSPWFFTQFVTFLDNSAQLVTGPLAAYRLV
ncbi:MAG: hypothetical protein ABSH28_22210 [Acidobacteriota bacterium]